MTFQTSSLRQFSPLRLPRNALRPLIAAAVLILAALVLLVPPMALAAQSVELRSDASIHDGRVTLGDLFDNAGLQAGIVEQVAERDPAVVDRGVRAQLDALGRQRHRRDQQYERGEDEHRRRDQRAKRVAGQP